jgi:hypothetical protein
MHATITKLAIDWLSVIPFTIHSLVDTRHGPVLRRTFSLDACSSYSVVVNYNTIPHASLFLRKFPDAF